MTADPLPIGKRRGRAAREIIDLVERSEALVRSDPHRALALADAAIALADKADRLAGGLALRARAHALRLLTHYTDAAESYSAAIEHFRAAGREEEMARTVVGKMDALTYLGHYQEALGDAAWARAMLDRAGDTASVAKIDLNAGIVHAHLEQPAIALRHFRRAKRAFAVDGDESHVAMAEANVGNALAQLDRFDAALWNLKRARARYARLDMPLMAATLDLNLGYVWSCRGEHLRALDHLLHARGVFVEHDIRADVATTDLDVAQSYLALHMVPETVEACSEAVKIFRAEGMPRERSQALVYEAEALGSNDPEKATNLLLEARSAFALEGNRVWCAMVDLRLAALEPDPVHAAELAERATAVFSELGLDRRANEGLLTLGQARERLGDRSEARRRFARAVERAVEQGFTQLRFRGLHALARLDRSLPLYREASELLEILRSGLGAGVLRVAFAAAATTLYEEIGELLREAKDLEGLFFAAEAARARTLADQLGGDRKARQKSAPGTVEDLRGRVRALQARLRAAELGEDRTEIAELQRSATRVERQLLARLRAEYIFAAARGTRTSADIIGVEDAQRALQEGQVLVEYFSVADRILALRIRRDGVRMYEDLAGTEQVRALLAKLRFQFSTCARRGEDWVAAQGRSLVEVGERYLRELHERLIAPLELAGVHQVVVAPYGPLHEVPFHALYDGRSYLLERYEIMVTPSATVWGQARRAGAPSGPALVMGSADEFAPTVEQEAREIARTLGVRPYVRSRASRATFVRRAPSASLIHLAAHATARADNPDFSAIHFCDGPLAVHDLATLRLRAKLAVLSACATGSGVSRAGDELTSLARAFLAAGVQNVIVSLWPVWDRATSIMMRRVYGLLAGGQDPAAALRQAQRELRASYPHPYFWAPFVTVVAQSREREYYRHLVKDREGS